MQAALIISGVIMLALFVIPLFCRAPNFGSITGTAAGIIYIICGIEWSNMSFTVQKIAAFIAFLLIILFVGAAVLIMRGIPDRATNQKVIIVLGCRVNGDTPSLALEKRMDAAYFFLLSNPDSVAVLSGGQGRDENISEALCMKEHLTYRGISADRLIMEDKSVSTYQNIKFSKQYIERFGVKEVAVATSDYHQRRAALVCKKFGFKAYSAASRTDVRFLPSFILRETFALIREYAKK